jgi:hypothetical protein
MTVSDEFGFYVSKEAAVRIALSMYVGEPCRYCGKPITQDDVHTAVFAGYSSDNKSRTAHKVCWNKHNG